jgi:hypothetical protein
VRADIDFIVNDVRFNGRGRWITMGQSLYRDRVGFDSIAWTGSTRGKYEVEREVSSGRQYRDFLEPSEW